MSTYCASYLRMLDVVVVPGFIMACPSGSWPRLVDIYIILHSSTWPVLNELAKPCET